MSTLDSETKSLFNKVRVKLGAPVRKIQLDDDQLYTLLGMCVEDYSEKIQNFLIESQWSSLYGKNITTTDMTFAFMARTMDYANDYSYWFSKEVGLQQRGKWELKKDYITIEAGKQSYVVPAGREINKVMLITPQTTESAIMGGMGALGGGLYGGALQMGGGFNSFGGTVGGYGGSFMFPAYDTMLIASDLKMKQNLFKSDLVYKVTAGPNETRIIHVLSTPGSTVTFGGYSINDNGAYSVVGHHIWYTYYDTTHKNADKCRKQNPDVLLTPDQVPIDKMEFSLMNEPSKTLIRQLLVAESKILLGNIRGTNSGKISIADAEMTMDYAIFLEQGKEEKEKVYTDLTDRLTRMMPLAQMETQAKIAESLNNIKKYSAPPTWLVI